MTCARCNDTRRVTEPGADPCATPEEVWCPECSNPPPPFVPTKPGYYWGRHPRRGTWEPVFVIKNLRHRVRLCVQIIGANWAEEIDDWEFGPKIERPAGLT